MAKFSIALPDMLAKASQEVAKKLGLSRTQFIRQSIAHELERIELALEKEAIIKSLAAMKKSQDYLEETEQIMENLNTELPDDKEER